MRLWSLGWPVAISSARRLRPTSTRGASWNSRHLISYHCVPFRVSDRMRLGGILWVICTRCIGRLAPIACIWRSSSLQTFQALIKTPSQTILPGFRPLGSSNTCAIVAFSTSVTRRECRLPHSSCRKGAELLPNTFLRATRNQLG
jgi:hypothetical protein